MMTRPLKGVLLGFLSCLLFGNARALEFSHREAQQWHPFEEWSVYNPSWTGDPFDVVARVHFTHGASGEDRVTEMFYAGEQRWCFRFTGTRLGDWNFETTSDDPELAGHRGQVRVKANTQPKAQGFLKSYGNKWGWEGTETVMVPQLVMWDYITTEKNWLKHLLEDPQCVSENIEVFMKGHGFNGFHLPVIGGRWFEIQSESEAVDSSMRHPDPRTFEALESLVIATHKAGGMCHLWPWGDHQRRQTARSLEGGIGGPIDRRLQRAIAARLGPLPGWSMGYGFDLDEWVTAESLRVWRDSMHGLSGWAHFFGGRPIGPNHGLDHAADAAWNRGLDYSSYEHHRPTYDVYRAAMAATPGQPVFSEDRFRIRKGKYPEKDYDAELTRRGLYHSTLAGGVANIWGIHPDLSAGGRFPNRDQIRTYATFFHEKGRFLVDMKPANALVVEGRAHVLWSTSAQSLVAYEEGVESMTLDLRQLPEAARAVAVDTRQPYRELDLGALRPDARTTIAFPDPSDWVVAVGSFRQEQARRPEKASPELRFTDIWEGPTLNGGHGAMWADVDANGFPDLYLPLIIEGSLPDLFMDNQGAGKFVESGEERGIADRDGGSHGAAWCDLDNDGDFDLINGTTFDDGSGIQNDVFRNDGKGRFAEVLIEAIEARREATRAFISFDMDGDGDLDLFGVTNYRGTADPQGETNEVYRNEGGFRFEPVLSGALVEAPAGQGASDTDFDGDGDVDILAANRTGPVNLLTNDGEGNFTLTDPASRGIRHRAKDGVTTADMDSDGDLDLLLAGNGGQGTLYRNTGKGHFVLVQRFEGVAGYMGGFADLDNDGDIDLYFAGDSKVYLNDGRGEFSVGPSVPVAGSTDPRGVAFADLDDDGDVDFAVGDKRAHRNYIIRNDLKPGSGNWLKVRLVARNGQAGAFGAKVSVFSSGDRGEAQKLLGMREAQSNAGYLGQNDPMLHFGLGSQRRVDVEVRFLDGLLVRKTGVAVNQTVRIDAREPGVEGGRE